MTSPTLHGATSQPHIAIMEQSKASISLSEARWAAIVESADDAIISIDEHQRITIFNHGAQITFGYTPAEIIGQQLSVLLPSQSRSAHVAHVEGFANSAVKSRRMGERSRVAGRRKDGTEFAAEASISKIVGPSGTIFTAILRDITQREEASRMLHAQAAELREAHERIKLAMTATGLGLWERDLMSNMVTWSDAMYRIFGRDRGEFDGTPNAVLSFVHPDDRSEFRGTFENAIENRRSTFEHEARIVRPNGKVRWIYQRALMRADPDGNPAEILGVALDITDRKRLDELARQQALVQSQKMEAVGQLTGGLAHDFNNLLTVIIGNLELLDMKLEDPASRDLIRRADEAARMGARLTGRLLTFSRKRRLQPTVLSLNETIVNMMELLDRSLGEIVKVNSQLAFGLWLTRVDASEIENAVLNLAINARDAMPSGGTILIETSNVTLAASDIVQSEDTTPGDYVKLAISDTGTGMSPEVAARAFEPFFSTKEPGRGTGLGLSTIYGFVKQSGGFAAIYSELGKGTVVNLYLPRDQSGAQIQPASALVGETVRPVDETILVVEDNAQLRDLAVRRLEPLGYKLATAASGPAAIAYLDKGQPVDLVFTDVVMPGGMSGLDLMRWLNEHRPDVRVLLTSGFAAELVSETAGAGVDAPLLRKPYTQAELAAAVRETLRGRPQGERTSAAKT